MKKDLISIVIPVYNVEKEYFSECIKSIINQTYKNIEILLIVDENNKELYEMYNNYKDNHIKTILTNNKGVSYNRNIGIKNCNGKYIAFIDSDDYIKKDYIEKLYNNIIKTDAEISMCGCYIKSKNKIQKNYYFKNNRIFKTNEDKEILYLQIITKSPYGKKLKTRCGSVWGKLYKKDFILRNNLLFDEKLIRMEDSIFNLYAFNKANKIAYIKELLYIYRKRNNSLSNNYDTNVIKQFEIFFDKLKIFSNNIYNIEDALNARISISIYSYIRIYIFNKKNKMNLKDKINLLFKIINKDFYKKSLKKVNNHYLVFSQKIFVLIIKLLLK